MFLWFAVCTQNAFVLSCPPPPLQFHWICFFLPIKFPLNKHTQNTYEYKYLTWGKAHQHTRAHTQIQFILFFCLAVVVCCFIWLIWKTKYKLLTPMKWDFHLFIYFFFFYATWEKGCIFWKCFFLLRNTTILRNETDCKLE